jgi:antirestriction protein ArdC
MPKSRPRRRRLTDEERAAKRAADREKMAAATDQLRRSDGWQRWLTVRRHFHHYSLHNQLLIAHQCPGATYVAGFRRWLQLGYVVRKGEHSIAIWAPMPPSKQKLSRWKQEGKDPETRPRTRFRLVPVFDRSQVDPLPEFPGGPIDLEPPVQPIQGDSLRAAFDPLAAFAASLGYVVAAEQIDGSAQGYCNHATRRISVDAVSDGFAPNAQVAVEIHECAHALVRVGRSDEDPTLSYAEEEVVVECVAYTVCAALGLDTSGSSVPYVTSWGEGDDIERYAALIDRLARRIEDVVLDAIADADEETAVVLQAAA